MGQGTFLFIYLAGLIVFAAAYAIIQFGWQGIMERLHRRKILSISGTFPAKTLSGFNVEYGLTILCECSDKVAYKKARMEESDVQATVVKEYDEEVVRPFFYKQPYFFYFNSRPWSKNGPSFDLASPTTLHGIGKDEKVFGCDPPFLSLEFGLGRLPWEKYGCKMTFKSFELKPLRGDLAEENYAMLTNDQKKLIENDPRFSEFQESIAVAALKLRRDILDSNEGRHETDEIIIDTLKAGRGFKIKWKFKAGAGKEYELLGFRKVGGFHPDKWNEVHNGTLVVHSQIDGQVVEFLTEGEATFYTFFLREKEPPKKREAKLCSSIRFQVTIAAKDELEDIQKVLDQAGEEKPLDPRMTELLGELGLMMEFQDAMDSMERSLIEKVKAKKLSKDEREEKLEFVRDIVRIQREKYHP